MEKMGVVKDIMGAMAYIKVTRDTACGGECAKCHASCGEKEIFVWAQNEACANIGDKVLVSLSDKIFFTIGFLTYILPLILFFVSYIIVNKANLGENLSIFVSLSVLLISFLGAFLSEKYFKKKISYKVSRIINDEA